MVPRTPTDRDVAEELGRRIRARRKELGISQERLADLAGVHRTFSGAVERGETNTSITTLVRIARALQVDPGELIAGIEG